MTTDLELEAELMIYGETFGKIGSLKVSRKSNSVEQKIVKLELDNDFIEDVAKANNICSIRVTQYGDMRSFIGQSTATIDSYGESEDMVDYFDCLDADSQDSQSRVYDLTRKDSFNLLSVAPGGVLDGSNARLLRHPAITVRQLQQY